MTERTQIAETNVERPIVCRDCDRRITVCCFCDDPSCKLPMCDRCVRTALHEAVKQPHVHGG